MPAFYEFHDSILERLEWDGPALELTLNAVTTLADDNAPLAWGRQRIVLRIEDATLTGDTVEPEIWLLEGNLKSDGQDSLEQDQMQGDIAAALESATRISLHLFGMNEETQAYPTFDISGQSLTLRKLNLVEWSPKHIPVVKSPGAKFLGIGAFDSGISDLATNKAHLRDFGVKSMGKNWRRPSP